MQILNSKGIPSWQIREAWDEVGGANVSHIIALALFVLCPAAAIVDPLAAM